MPRSGLRSRLLPDLGRLYPLDRLEGPERSFQLGEVRLVTKLFRFGTQRLGPGLDPATNQGNLITGQTLLHLFRGHLVCADMLEKQALISIPGNHGRSGFTTQDNQPAKPQVEPPLEFLSLAMAMKTVGLENRPHVLFVRGLS